MIANVLDYVEKAAETHPDKIAFVEGTSKITYSDFCKRIKQRATVILQNKLSQSIFPRPVVIMQEKSIDALISFFSVAWTGNIYVPFDVDAPEERLCKMVEMLDPLFIISEVGYYEKIRRCAGDITIVNNADFSENVEVDEFLLAEEKRMIIDTDPLYIICTSGSTGIPKGVVVSHRSVIDFTEEASECMNFSANERFISQVPFYFDVSVLDIYCTLRSAAELHIIPKLYYVYPARVVNYIIEHEINALIWVPSALVLIANLKLLDDVDMSCLKKIMFCGEVMPNKQLNIWRRKIPDAQYVNYYGPAETTCASTYYIVDRQFSDDEPLPIGKPAYNTGIVILNEKNEIVRQGGIGELCIKGSGLALGYYNDIEKTRKSFIQNPLHAMYEDKLYKTGDLVKINEYGELMYMGRKDYQIKHMGYRIELGEIETAVSSLEGVQMNCCLYDEGRQQIILIYIGSIQSEDVSDGIRSKIPKYMFPQKIIRIDNMPLNANGKINRVLLKKKYLNEDERLREDF